MPFFYWYQMTWIPVTACLVGISYWVVTKEDRRRREAAQARRNGGQE
jgi:hypothetical protein